MEAGQQVGLRQRLQHAEREGGAANAPAREAQRHRAQLRGGDLDLLQPGVLVGEGLDRGLEVANFVGAEDRFELSAQHLRRAQRAAMRFWFDHCRLFPPPDWAAYLSSQSRARSWLMKWVGAILSPFR